MPTNKLRLCRPTAQPTPPTLPARLQQPVQNPISDNTNVLWNSPYLGKNYNYRVPLVL